MNINLLNLTDLYSLKHPEFNIEYHDEIYKKLQCLLELLICSNREILLGSKFGDGKNLYGK